MKLIAALALLVTGTGQAFALISSPKIPKAESALLVLQCPIADLDVSQDCKDLGFYCDDNNEVKAKKSGHEESPCFDWCKCVADI
ncbi:uncharacterized protein QC761_108890 [Podospora bellae-mahoneyi]|uniref:Uncharacterized protein n=1 Tax=Podospora bellae-mahoneyi TaxID=2093777 RepID=A0ABR0FYD9_9PEZI|nr:hypothetical protein QC761_108890 [Podospora bellae-mahoneyi]